MNEWSLDPKTRTTLILLYGAIVYMVAATAILVATLYYIRDSNSDENMVALLFFLLLFPLLAIFIAVWGYGFKLRMPGLELDYYPVEKVMQPPSTVTEDMTVEDAEKIMDNQDTDFLNILDRNGIFQGIFTKADAHKARLRKKAITKVKNFMTSRDKVINALEREDIKSIMKKIGQTKHSRLPVLDKNNRLIGVVDSVDINDLLAKILK